MKNNTHILIQTRMGATRLPGKVLMLFSGGHTFLEWIVERCKTSKRANKIVIATTDSPKDDPVVELCAQKGYDFFRGSEDDVLGRYHAAAQKFGTGILARVLADSPFTDIGELDHLLEVLTAEGLDYTKHPAGALPSGMGSEVFTMRSFERVFNEAKDPYEHEHITPYYYRHLELFRQREVPPLCAYTFAPEMRFALDTPQDLKFLRSLARTLDLATPVDQPSTNAILARAASL